ncbi:MAG: mechanosensitive ion channel domain-containing protein [Phycisphaerae bacterium]|jgi:small conductance mechanosensitive channel
MSPQTVASTPAAADPSAPALTPPQSIEQAADKLQTFADQTMSVVAHYAPSVLGAVIFFIVAWIASGMFAGLLLRTLQRTHIEPTISKFLSTLLRWSLIALSTVACLGMFGVNITAFAAVFGAVGLAIGLALQGSLSNLAAGVMLLLFRPFKVGDAISVAGQSGLVDEIELFSTRLDTPDNRRIIIPNAAAFNAIVENTSHHERRRVDVAVGVDYRSEIPATREALLAAVATLPQVLEQPAPSVSTVRFGKSAIEWQVSAWANRTDFGAVQQALMQSIQSHLAKAGITMVPTL